MENQGSERVEDEFVPESNGDHVPVRAPIVPIVPPPVPGNSNPQESVPPFMSGFPSDPTQLQVLLMQAMLSNQAQQKENIEIQKQNQNLMAQLVMNSRTTSEKKLSNCSKKQKESSLEAWMLEVKMWERPTQGKGHITHKYLYFFKSVRCSEAVVAFYLKNKMG